MTKDFMHIILTKSHRKLNETFGSLKYLQLKSQSPITLTQVDMSFLDGTKLDDVSVNKILTMINAAKENNPNVLIDIVGEEIHFDQLYEVLADKRDPNVKFKLMGDTLPFIR